MLGCEVSVGADDALTPDSEGTGRLTGLLFSFHRPDYEQTSLVPGCEVSMDSTSCLILTSGQVELAAHAAVLLAAGWVGEATVLAIEAGTGGVTAMAAGKEERTVEG